MTPLLGFLLMNLMMHVTSVNISLGDICGNKLVGTCPDKINVKVTNMFNLLCRDQIISEGRRRWLIVC